MKKLVATMLTVLTCGAAFALPVGNPTEASLFMNGAWTERSCGSTDICDPCFSWCDIWSFRAGFYGDYVFNRHLELDPSDSTDTDEGPDVLDTEIYTNASYLALNFWDRFDVFATLGSTDLSIFVDRTSFGGVSEGLNIEFETSFSWSVGGRLTLWECDCFGLGVEGQYFRTRPDLTYVNFSDSGIFVYPADDTAVTYSEWQVGFGASYRFSTNCPTFAMVPYVAAKWSGSSLQGLNGRVITAPVASGEGSVTLVDMNNKKAWGFATGVSLTLNDMIGLNVEGRFGDEKAVSVNGQFRF